MICVVVDVRLLFGYRKFITIGGRCEAFMPCKIIAKECVR